MATTSMAKNMKASGTTELSTLYEISSLRFSESEKSFAREVVEKAAGLFNVRRLALYAGNGAGRRLIASLAGPDKDRVSDLANQGQPNRCQFALGADGKLGTLYVEQEQAIDSRQRRLYHVFARQLEQNLKLVREAAEREQMEEELRQSGEYSSTILNNSPNPMLVTNPDSSIGYVNPAFEALSGFSLSELIDQKAPYPWWTDETIESIKEGFEMAFRQGVKSREHLFKKKNGERFWVEVTGTPIMIDGQFKLYLASWVDITERKRMEEELIRNRDYLERLNDSITDMVYDIKFPERTIQYINKSVEKVLGYSPEECIGKNVEMFYFSRSDYDEAGRRVREGIERGEQYIIAERKMRRKDGKGILVEVRTNILREHGKPVAVLSTIRDITERKRMEEEILKFKKIADIAAYGLSLATPEGVMTYVNESFARLHGYTPDELIGKHFNFLYNEEQLKDMQRFRKKLWRYGSVLSEEVWHTRKDGTAFLTLTSANLVKDDGGNPLFTAGSVIDITERKRIEEALRHSEERLAQLYDEAPVGYHELDREGRIIQVNQTELDMIGYTAEEMLGRHVWDFMVESGTSSKAFAAKMAGTMPPGKGFERTYRRKDGTTVPILIEDRYVKDESGQVVGLRSTMQDITGRKRAEQALKESEEKFSRVFHSNPHPMSLVTLEEGSYLDVNDSYVQTFGFSRKELLGRTSVEMGIIEAETARKKILQALGKKQAVKNLDVELYTKSGRRVNALLSGDKMEINGRTCLLCVISDITERKKMEQELRESEEKLNAVVNSAGANIHMLDKDCNIIWTNQASRNMYGEDIIGRKCYEAFHQLKEPCQPFPCPTFQALRDGKTREWENKVINKDGQMVYVNVVSSVALRDEEGNPQAVVEINRDITDRKKAGEALKESEERYRALVNLGANIGEAVVMLQDDERGAGMHTFVNEEWTHITGYSEEELLNISMSDIIHPRDREEALVRHRKRIRGEELSGLYELSIIRKDGTEVPVEVTFAHSNYKGKPANVGYIRDITDRKQMEEALQKKMEELENAYSELQKIDEMKDSFLSTVSHELRTPLTSIKGFAEILLSYEEDRETQKEFLNIINEESERLTRLIDDLLDLARLESGRQEWVTDRIAITDIITQAVHAVHSLVTQKRLNIQTDLASDLPYYAGDKDRLIQVVTNLLSNAIKFTPEEGEIKVKAELVKDTQSKKPVEAIRVSVSDTGIGIEAKNQEAVFERFKQVGDTMTDKPKGTGLGLPICKEIVEYYKGRMWVESEPGKGSTFYFTLPLDKKVKAEAPEPQEIREAVAPKVGKTILVVDDEDHVRRFLSHEFTKRGYRVFEATNGHEAISLAREQLPDLITLDVLMPEIDGYDATAILKNDEETKDIPILIISVIEDKQKAFHLGANDYLTKPFKIGMVMEKISKLLRKAQKTVLVVDDDKALVKSLKYKLEKRGISTYVAYNGKEALQVVHQTPPNLILLDIIMPEMDGYEVMSRLKRNQKTAPIPVIVLTGVEIDGGRVKALSLGADDYVTKSDGLNKLFENIETYISDH